MSHFFSVIWDWVKIHGTVQNIGLATLVVLLLTPFFVMAERRIGLRKKIRFTQIRIDQGKNSPTSEYRSVYFNFSNNCNRVIRIRNGYLLTTLGKLKENHGLGNIDLDEGDDDHADITIWDIPFTIKDIYAVVIIDSVGKKYRGWVYNGQFRNRWYVWFRRTIDFIIEWA